VISSLAGDDPLMEIPGLNISKLIHGRNQRPDPRPDTIQAQHDRAAARGSQERQRLDKLIQEQRSQRPKTQIRTPWSEDEIKRLIHLWIIHGSRWSQILKIDARMSPPSLLHRSQVDLKDKIRNIKIYMMR
jgi:hypothetical protein